jgi:hypothetical protein
MKITHWLSFAILIAVAGCEGEGITRPPPTDVRIFNAAPNAAAITLRREQDFQNPASFFFGAGDTRSFDSGPYEFNLDYTTISGLIRADSLSETLSPDLDYMFVAVSPGGQPELLLFATDNRPANAATPRVTIAHAFPGRGDLDVYLELPGTTPAGASPRGTISFGADALTFEIPPETYKIYLTAAGDPNDIVFESTNRPIEAIAANREVVYVVTDPGGQGTADIALYRVGTSVASTGAVGQIGLQSAMRVVHGLTDRLDRDIHLDDTLSPPLFPAQAFGVVSDYAEMSFGTHDLIVTPLGNPGTEELTANHIAFPGVLYTFLIGNTFDGGIAARIIDEDKRSIRGQATVSVLNDAGLFEAVAVYIEPPGTDVTNLPPPIALAPLGFVPREPLIPGDYEITVENPLTDTILAGPVPITVDEGGVYGILLVNGAGGSTVDIVLFDDFVP